MNDAADRAKQPSGACAQSVNYYTITIYTIIFFIYSIYVLQLAIIIAKPITFLENDAINNAVN